MNATTPDTKTATLATALLDPNDRVRLRGGFVEAVTFTTGLTEVLTLTIDGDSFRVGASSACPCAHSFAEFSVTWARAQAFVDANELTQGWPRGPDIAWRLAGGES